MPQPLIDQNYILKKYPGKGGWTYAEIPEIKPNKHAHFGWVKVSGMVDDYQIDSYNLMPMSSGKLFFPIRAEIRKKIGKQAGDTVRIVLYADVPEPTNEQELNECLELEPKAHQRYQLLSQAERQELISHVSAAATENEKAERIVALMDRLMR